MAASSSSSGQDLACPAAGAQYRPVGGVPTTTNRVDDSTDQECLQILSKTSSQEEQTSKEQSGFWVRLQNHSSLLAPRAQLKLQSLLQDFMVRRVQNLIWLVSAQHNWKCTNRRFFAHLYNTYHHRQKIKKCQAQALPFLFSPIKSKLEIVRSLYLD